MEKENLSQNDLWQEDEQKDKEDEFSRSSSVSEERPALLGISGGLDEKEFLNDSLLGLEASDTDDDEKETLEHELAGSTLVRSVGRRHSLATTTAPHKMNMGLQDKYCDAMIKIDSLAENNKELQNQVSKLKLTLALTEAEKVSTSETFGARSSDSDQEDCSTSSLTGSRITTYGSEDKIPGSNVLASDMLEFTSSQHVPAPVEHTSFSVDEGQVSELLKQVGAEEEGENPTTHANLAPSSFPPHEKSSESSSPRPHDDTFGLSPVSRRLSPNRKTANTSTDLYSIGLNGDEVDEEGLLRELSANSFYNDGNDLNSPLFGATTLNISNRTPTEFKRHYDDDDFSEEYSGYSGSDIGLDFNNTRGGLTNDELAASLAYQREILDGPTNEDWAVVYDALVTSKSFRLVGSGKSVLDKLSPECRRDVVLRYCDILEGIRASSTEAHGNPFQN
mmetsp:Transcript_15869/g.28253  ORF Transcript_15869/g.28253 Transcript_15869/m.28253 type:complete len:449 (+) Transcript_15869:336-1682(+)